VLVAGEGGTPRAFPKIGEWPRHRANGTLDGRAAIKGRITEPQIVWKHFIGRVESLVIVEPAKGQARLELPLKDSATGSNETSDPRWGMCPPAGNLEGRVQPVRNTTTVVYADVLPDGVGMEKIEFESGFSRPTVAGRWPPCVGRCFTWKDGTWVEVWRTDPIPLLFVPLPIVGDFDADGHPEVAILPWYELLILDARTGRIKDRCRFTDGRSYGFFGVYDIDGQGQGEFVVQADFSKHVDVLGYRSGKLAVLWQWKIESDISNPQTILRVNPNPVVDVDGDGRLEVLVNLYNGSSDGRWHLTVHDGATGQTMADLPDEHLQGVVDVDGDGIAELLTTRTKGAAVPACGTILVRSFKGGRVASLWEQTDAGWQTWDPPLPPHVNSGATLGQRTVLCRVRDGRTAAVVRRPSPDRPGDVLLVRMVWRDGGFKADTTLVGPDLDAMAMDGDGNLLVRCTGRPDTPSQLTANGGRFRPLGSRGRGVVPATVVVGNPDRSNRAYVVAQGCGEELVIFHPPQGNSPAAECRRIRGRGQSTSWPETLGPVLADLSGDGRRQLLYATDSPTGCARLAVTDLEGPEVWHHDVASIPAGLPVWNTGAIVLWQTGHFTDRKRQDVLVTIRRSMMHSEETLLLSGRDGRRIWHRDRQISGRGVGGTPFAVADYDGDGLDDIASFHPSIVYVLKGATGEDLVARDASWDPVPAKPVYWGLPVAGDFEGTGRMSLFMAGAAMTALVRSDGTLVWWDALDQSARHFAFGDFDGDRRVEAIGVGYEDGMRCYDTATGTVTWRMPSVVKAVPTGTAGADLNSDGRDEALLVDGKTLWCLGTSENGARGHVLWRCDLPVNVGPPSVADVDGSATASIVLVGEDGFVYCVR